LLLDGNSLIRAALINSLAVYPTSKDRNRNEPIQRRCIFIAFVYRGFYLLRPEG
jgi:hypothetical protein